MEIVDLKWEQNEMEIEEEEVGGLQERSYKAIKEVLNGKIETNGHANSTLKITNGTEKSDLDDEQERSEEEEQLSDSINGVEVEEVTEPKFKLAEQIVVSNNGVEVEEGTEKSVLDDEQERSKEEDLSDFNNGVEVEEGKEKSDLDDEQESSEEHLSDSSNGVEEGTEKSDLDDEQESSEEHLSDSSNGVEEGTEKSDLDDELERSKEEQLSDSNNGVEVEEETKPKEESVQHIVLSNNGVEERTEPKEELVQQIVATNNGVEEETELKEEAVEQTVVLNNGVEVEEGTEPKKESVQQLVASDNGVEEGTEPKEESKQHLVTPTNGVEVEEESIQQIVVSNNGVEEGTEAKEESKQHLGTPTNGVEEGTEAEEGPFRSAHSVYYHKDEDSNFISTPSIKEKIDKIPGDEGVQEISTLDIQLNGHLKSDNLLRSSVQFTKDLSEDHSIVRKSTAIDEIESAEADLIDDSDTDVKDLDVENVLQKQNTHDLYCPEFVVDPEVDASHAQAADNEVRDEAYSSLDGTPPLAADDFQPDREPEIFRCLSCFSFFIPAGTDLCITLLRKKPS